MVRSAERFFSGHDNDLAMITHTIHCVGEATEIRYTLIDTASYAAPFRLSASERPQIPPPTITIFIRPSSDCGNEVYPREQTGNVTTVVDSKRKSIRPPPKPIYALALAFSLAAIWAFSCSGVSRTMSSFWCE